MTIKDLARLAGVAHSTVSRSLNDSPLVSEETRTRIKLLAKEHGYAPNTFAQKLVTRKSQTLGLFFLSRQELNFMENFGTQFLSGITDACHQSGYDLLLFTTPLDLAGSKSYLQLCRERQVEGVIFIGVTSNDPHLQEIADSSIPVTIIDYQLQGERVNFIGSDNQKGIAMALELLWSWGHRRIAFIGGPEVSQVAMERESVYRSFLEERGAFNHSLIFRGNFSKDSGYYKAVEILKADPVPTAVLAANDSMALGAIKAFKEHGLRVPVDISVMGYDNAAAGEFADPGLTTIGQNAEAIGSGAVKLILDQINSPTKAASLKIEPSLILRESVRRIPQ